MLKLLELLVLRGLPPVSKDRVRQEANAADKVAGEAVAARFTRGNVAIQREDTIFKDDLGPPGAPSKK